MCEKNRNNLTIEVCCASSEDVVRAAAAGADRAELNLALEAGGLTPSIGMLKTALRYANIPIVCMVRPRAGGFCYSELEYASMLDDAKRLMDAGASGIVFGILTADGALDAERCARMVEMIGSGEAVFHRAFDLMHGELEAELDALIDVGIDRVLTSGRKTAAVDGIAQIRRCVEHAAGRIAVLAGGGVRPHNAARIIRETGVRQVHSTFHYTYADRSGAYSEVGFDAPGSEPFAVRVVDEETLRKYIAALRAEV